jgi:hypothetical protein
LGKLHQLFAGVWPQLLITTQYKPICTHRGPFIAILRRLAMPEFGNLGGLAGAVIRQ